MNKVLIGVAVLTVATQSVQAQSAGASAIDCRAVLNAPMDASMDHAAHMAALDKCRASGSTSTPPTASGQAAYAAISEVVRVLEADPATDWSKVNVEALRAHLIDMDEVTLHAVVAQRAIDGGFVADVTGRGRTVDAIRRMTTNHFAMLDSSSAYRARVAPLPAGVRVTVVARQPNDARAVAIARGLGFIGLLTEGDHHATHHLSIARGESMHR